MKFFKHNPAGILIGIPLIAHLKPERIFGCWWPCDRGQQARHGTGVRGGLAGLAMPAIWCSQHFRALWILETLAVVTHGFMKSCWSHEFQKPSQGWAWMGTCGLSYPPWAGCGGQHLSPLTSPELVTEPETGSHPNPGNYQPRGHIHAC